ncbi:MULTISPECIES: hypothetical protein [unclassified Polaribacter]|uniref:hypothetical protein n=1 Tax=unclassified Polaribacter TaxID=196858 RepID=UPI0011BFAB56|nr:MULTISPECIES: hypothetical protein [unclassified Polaribacter]TXD50914.1 hypothetical protein ES043_14085 [Polaribacter sp. IC063]TXD62293.1 hypothetical protein ES044_01985 [Polaribacter sp. IC066]
MKKIIPVLLLFLSFSCANSDGIAVEPIIIDLVPKDIDIIITTGEPIFDEIVLSYKDFDTEEEWNYGPRQFDYDSNGNAIPIVISFKDYQYSSIIGNAYRNNDIPSSLKAQIFINDSLVLEDESIGSPGIYATINFDYEISN